MFRRREISIRRQRSWRDMQLVLAATMALLALAVPSLKFGAGPLGLDADLANGMAFACLCAAMLASAQTFAWGRLYRADVQNHDR